MHVSVVVRAALVAAVALSAAGASTASAQSGPSLLVNTNASGMYVYGGLRVGGGAWGGTTSMLQNAFGARMSTTGTLPGFEPLSQFDALWIDQRYQAAPTAAELASLGHFIQTGRRVVIVGENFTWGPWTSSILGALGGNEGGSLSSFPYYGAAPGCAYGAAHTVLASQLTAGVSAVNMACGGFAVGGTALFDYNVATLWGAQQNVLTILDANVLDDPFGSKLDGRRFQQNVVDWISTSTRVQATAAPEPTTIALLGAGLLALGVAARRRRTT
jgi:hypothetical protein